MQLSFSLAFIFIDEAKSLVEPDGIYPSSGRLSSFIRPLIVWFSVPSPPQHTTMSKLPSSSCIISSAPNPGSIGQVTTRQFAWHRYCTAFGIRLAAFSVPAFGLYIISTFFLMSYLFTLYIVSIILYLEHNW